jgi:hypothetical protein
LLLERSPNITECGKQHLRELSRPTTNDFATNSSCSLRLVYRSSIQFFVQVQLNELTLRKAEQIITNMANGLIRILLREPKMLRQPPIERTTQVLGSNTIYHIYLEWNGIREPLTRSETRHIRKHS